MLMVSSGGPAGQWVGVGPSSPVSGEGNRPGVTVGAGVLANVGVDCLRTVGLAQAASVTSSTSRLTRVSKCPKLPAVDTVHSPWRPGHDIMTVDDRMAACF